MSAVLNSMKILSAFLMIFHTTADCALLVKRPFVLLPGQVVAGPSSLSPNTGAALGVAPSQSVPIGVPVSVAPEGTVESTSFQPIVPTQMPVPDLSTPIAQEPVNTQPSQSIVPPDLSLSNLATFATVIIAASGRSTTEAPSPMVTPAPLVPETMSFLNSGVPAVSVCTPYGCNIFFQYVGLSVTLEEGANTACQAGAGISPLTILSGDGTPTSNSVVVVFTSIRAFDGCNPIGTTFVDFTHTYAPGELSSARDGAVYSFNLTDLPCPPASVHWTDPAPYAPTIAFPPWMRILDPAWATCIAARDQGIDPFTVHLPGKELSPAKESGHPPLRRRALHGQGHEHAHLRARAAPRAVVATKTAG